MTDVKVHLTLRVSELDLIRESLHRRHTELVNCIQDTTVPIAERAEARATAMRLGDLLDKLDA
jgi:hypothetical protein